MPLLNADHPGVKKAIRKTVIHEVGHALGLRHNFIGCEDGNSSVMAYVDPLDTLGGEAGQAVFGGHFLTTPGVYDAYAIRYGYTPLEGETLRERHRGRLTPGVDGYFSKMLPI